MPQQATRKVGDVVSVRCDSFSIPIWRFSNFEQREFTEISSKQHSPLTIQVNVASRGIYECKGNTYLYSYDFLAQFILRVIGKN